MTNDNQLFFQRDEDKAAMFKRLRALKAACGPNRNDQVTVLIQACMVEGVCNGRRILAVLAHLGFKAQHVGLILKDGIGHTWTRDDSGTYSLK